MRGALTGVALFAVAAVVSIIWSAAHPKSDLVIVHGVGQVTATQTGTPADCMVNQGAWHDGVCYEPQWLKDHPQGWKAK